MNLPDYKRITAGCGLAVAAIGAIVLAGWFLESRRLAAIHADYIPMAPNTALLFVLVGSGLVNLERKRRWSDWSARLAAALVITIAFLRFLEFTTPFQFNVDHWIFRFPMENRWVAPETSLFPVGRMAFFTALNFMCAATALLMFACSGGRTRQPLAAAGAIITLIIGLVFALGYVYGSPLLYGGTAIPMALNTAGAFVLSGLGLLLMISGREAAERQRAREALQQAHDELESSNRRLEAVSRYKSEFLANMSHEFRTPLNSIIGFSEILGDPAFGPVTDQQARFAQNIRVSGEHLLVLVNDLLDLAKIEAGRIVLRAEPFECREAVHAAVAEIRSQANQKHLDLEVQVDEAPPTLTADPVRFKQILLNLLSNAVKFTLDGGRITVTVRRTLSVERGALSDERRAESVDPQSLYAPLSTLHGEDFVEIAVSDTGIGIKPDDLPRLFQEFVRLETDTAIVRRAAGTGLGLALTKRLVDLHGGTIAAASEGEGRGSTFTVRLPLAIEAR